MSTFELYANTLQFTYVDDSIWKDGRGAFQGAYKNGSPRVGAIMFNQLRNSIDWKNMVVSEVRLWLQFGGAGYPYTKTIGLYTTSRNSIGGSGGNMLGTFIGQFNSGVGAYNASATYTFNENTNASMFARLASWIEESSINGLAVYVNETRRTGDFSANYLTITSAHLSIDYDVRGSSGTITPSSAEVGDTVTLEIDPLESETGEVVSHTLQWICGNSESQVITLAGGVLTANYTIPSGWLGEIPTDETSTTAIARLTTFIGETQFGTRDIPFTVNVPARYAPVIDEFSVKRYMSYTDDQGQIQYKESLSGNHVWVNLDGTAVEISGVNEITTTLRYYPAADESQAQSVTITWADLPLVNDISIITGTIAISEAFVFELTATNGHHTAHATSRVEKSWAPFHVAGSGYGVGIGMYSDGTLQEPKFQCAWDAYFNGAMNIGANAIKGLVDVVYPVGSLFISTQDSDDPDKELPEELFPGTSWSKIKDKFLLSAGDTYNAGDTGGAASASHYHVAPVAVDGNIFGSVNINGTDSGGNGASYATTNIMYSGTLDRNVTLARTGNATVSTMPPYLVVNVWERTA